MTHRALAGVAVGLAVASVAALAQRVVRRELAARHAVVHAAPVGDRLAARHGAVSSGTPAVVVAPSSAIVPEAGAETTLARVAAPMVPAGVGDRALALAAPRTVQLVTVPVPEDVPGDSVPFAVEPTGAATLLGPLTGVVAATGNSPRMVVVTVSVPAHAVAGERTVAQVTFARPDGGRSIVPVALNVMSVHSAALRLAQSLFGVKPGEHVALRYFLTNTGNSPDTFVVTLAPPPGWLITGSPARFILGPSGMAAGQVDLAVSRDQGFGSVNLRLEARDPAGTVARVPVVVEVVSGPASPAASGPNVTAGVASVLTGAGTASPVFGLEASGPLTPTVQMTGRLVQATDPGATDARALSRVGYVTGAPYLLLNGPTWSAGLGTVGRTFTDLTGVNVYGTGATATATFGRWTASALAASAPSGVSGSGGGFFGGQVREQVGEAWVGATVTHLEDDIIGARRLTAVGVSALAPVLTATTLGAEIAGRSWAGGSGVGLAGDLQRHTTTDFEELKFVHAPGGSAAFAPARDQVLATANRQLSGAWSFGAGYWLTTDQSAAFSELRSMGWTLGPRLAVDDRTTLTAEARHDGFTAASAAGTFGNGETALRLGVMTSRGQLFGSGDFTVGQATRDAGLPSGGVEHDVALRQQLRAAAGVSTTRGTLQASLAFDHSGAGVGYLPRQLEVDVSASRISLRQDGSGPLFSADVTQYSWFGDQPALTAVRAGVTAPLPGQLELTFDVEHNALLQGVTNAAWVPVVKVTRALHVPLGALQPVAKGVVYRDLNGNGVRDAGEPAIAGVVVRRGEESAVTDGSGTFKFFERGDEPVRVDETSLPFGLVANPAASVTPVHEGRVDIGVLPTASVDVRLVATADSQGFMPHVDVKAVPVYAVDDSGGVWTARTDSAGRARFDALPPGHYRLEFDFSGLREPVRLKGGAPTFDVAPGQEVPAIVVPLYSRPIRMFDPGGAGRGQNPRRTHGTAP